MSAADKRLPNVDAVVFDAVGTLIFPQPSVADAYSAAIYRHCGVRVDTATVKNAVQRALGTRSLGEALRTNEEAEQQFWANLIRQLCPDSGGFQDCFDDLFAHFADPGNWQCFPDVAGVLAGLEAADLPMAIASNFDRRLNAVCDGLPPIQQISARVISSEVGWRKPSAQFFAAVADQLQVRADRILMVGDDLHNDVRGALAAGMQAAWICRGREQAPAAAGEPRAFVMKSLHELPALLANGVSAQAQTIE